MGIPSQDISLNLMISHINIRKDKLIKFLKQNKKVQVKGKINCEKKCQELFRITNSLHKIKVLREPPFIACVTNFLNEILRTKENNKNV